MSARPKVTDTIPLFVVSDLQRSIDFYGKLGFIDATTWGDPPHFAMMHRDQFDIMLSMTDIHENIHPNGPHGTWDLYIKVAAVHPEINALKSAGVTIDRGPVKTEYGLEEIDVLDPDGYRICIAEDLG